MEETIEQQIIAVGQRIKFYRKETRLTTASAAEQAGISYATLCNIENGKANIRLLNLLKIVDFLQIPPAFLFRPLNKNINYIRDGMETDIISRLPKLSDHTLEMLCRMTDIMESYDTDYNFNAIPATAARQR